jgi:hypothetical protein
MSFHYLLEDGSGALLLENGGFYLLENAAGGNSSKWNQPPQDFALTVNGHSNVTLTWTPTGSSLVIGYYVWRDGVILTPLPVVGGTYIDTAIIADRRYAYAVSAVDSLHNYGPQTPTLQADVLQGTTLTFESVYQLQPGEGGYPDILWRWQ